MNWSQLHNIQGISTLSRCPDAQSVWFLWFFAIHYKFYNRRILHSSESCLFGTVFIFIHGAARKSEHCNINTRTISRHMGYNSLQISINSSWVTWCQKIRKNPGKIRTKYFSGFFWNGFFM